MSTLTRPRGRLPRRVYWLRRGLVLVVAGVLVVGIANLLNLGGGSSPAPVKAGLTSSQPRQLATAPTAYGPTMPAASRTGSGPTASPTAPLAMPTGPCQADEVTVTPAIKKLGAGQRLQLPLVLTGTQPACTFAVSAKTVVLQLAQGGNQLWSSQACPRSIPAQDVVVRNAVPTTIKVSWNGRKAVGSCSHTTAFVLPGYYEAEAAAMGSAPAQEQFQLVLPARATITKTSHPKRTATPTATPTANGSPSGKPTSRPSSSPTGTPTGG